MNAKEILPTEDILPDDYPVYGDYIYIADGKIIRCDLLSGTVADLKRDLESIGISAKEIRRCDLVERVLI